MQYSTTQNMDTNKGGKNIVFDSPTSAFTRYVREPQSTEAKQTQNDRSRRKSAFARIKQLFSLQSPDTAST
jgi:hypothetical protein